MEGGSDGRLMVEMMARVRHFRFDFVKIFLLRFFMR
jgi:hypothetical protein